jgi:hypothetical protein
MVRRNEKACGKEETWLLLLKVGTEYRLIIRNTSNCMVETDIPLWYFVLGVAHVTTSRELPVDLAIHFHALPRVSGMYA